MVKVAPVVFFFACTTLNATCYGPGRQTHAPALLRMHTEPPDARVRIDDRYSVSARTLAVQPRPLGVGHHQITVEAPGYFPHDLDVDLPEGETTVEVHLRPVPP